MVAMLFNSICCSTSLLQTPITRLQSKYDFNFSIYMISWICCVNIPVLLCNLFLVDTRDQNDAASVITDAGTVIEDSFLDWVSHVNGRRDTLTVEDTRDDINSTQYDVETVYLNDKQDKDYIDYIQVTILGVAVSLFMAPIATLYTSKILAYMGPDFADKAGLGFTIWNILAAIPQAILLDSGFPWIMFSTMIVLSIIQANSLHTLIDSSNSVLNWLAAVNMWTLPIYLTIRFRYTQRLIPKNCGVIVGSFFVISGSSILLLVIITKSFPDNEKDVFFYESLLVLIIIPTTLLICSILEVLKKKKSKTINDQPSDHIAIHTDF